MDRHSKLLVLIGVLIVCVLVAAVAQAAPPPPPVPSVDWYVIGGGGDAEYGDAVYGTVGQPVAGFAGGRAQPMCAGFWCGLWPGNRTWVPMLRR